MEAMAAGVGQALVQMVDRVASAAADGSEPALEVLLFAIDHHRLADPGIRRILMEADAVDEVGQDVLIAVTESIDSWAGVGRFTSWLYTVGRNRAVAYVRRRHPTPQGDGEDLVSDTERISSIIALRIDAERLIADLPELYRDSVRLRDLEGNTYEDVASMLGLPLNTARSRICRGRAILARRLHGSGPE